VVQEGLGDFYGPGGAPPSGMGYPYDPGVGVGGNEGDGSVRRPTGRVGPEGEWIPPDNSWEDAIAGLPGMGVGLPDLYAGLPGYSDYGSLDPSLDLGSLPGIPGEGDLMGLRGDVESALFERSMNLLNPELDRRESTMNEALANRGLPIGSEIYGEETGRFDDLLLDTKTRAAQEAVIGGGSEMSRMLADAMGVRGQTLSERLSQLGASQGVRSQLFGEDLSKRGQAFNENLTGRGQLFGEQMGTRGQLFNELLSGRGQEFSELASILGLAQMPGMPQGPDPGAADVMGGYGMMQNQNMANMMAQQDMWGGIMQFAGPIIGAMIAGSSVDYKRDIEPVNREAILEGVKALPVTRWKYKFEGDDSKKHIGPMAEDWSAAFGTPDTAGRLKGVDLVSMSGVAIAAIQALITRVENLEAELAAVRGS